MTQRNDGRGEINSLQNHFTAYLTVAVRRCKSRYLEDLRKLAVYEPSYDFQETPLDSTEEPDLLSGPPSWTPLRTRQSIVRSNPWRLGIWGYCSISSFMK